MGNKLVIPVRDQRRYLQHLTPIRSHIERSIESSAAILLSLKAEVERTIEITKSNKAPGPDEIPADVIKILDESSLQKRQSSSTLYIYPANDWLEAIFFSLSKKSKASTCEVYRLISLKRKSSQSKIQIYGRHVNMRSIIVHENIAPKILRNLCFIDYRTAFDAVGVLQRCVLSLLLFIFTLSRFSRKPWRIVTLVSRLVVKLLITSNTPMTNTP